MGAPYVQKILCTTTLSIGLYLMLWGCIDNDFQVKDVRWKTYKNNRYGFEFPYPNTWQELKNPDNSDGVVLVLPNKKNLEIRSYASKPLLKFSRKTQGKVYNFRTNQGVFSVLTVEVREKVTVIKLTITQEKLEYFWQGQSDSQEFKKYYRLFYYMAQEYKINR
ncbi:MAG: hypothetical protein LW814_17425 [Anabaena sp. CoA2_C59]|jgi:hypothetical protein|uniref:DUF4825 domain-containing protein n=1 Tax=Aphanizomenon flos-aquae FACHB-1249 TaxID=2692889 RepID=A0ABR8ITG2_APHFL|nr:MULTISPECIES: hypothetical protein [Aphanizomenon]MCE2906767.1 hypothetical protein [Anabaena sp. CoA2_C59]MDJ0503976.1 hypothetical protein [Nostocales cyanobacterium LE14-WE12]MBD2632145.1 hypothetical protein [Aphanizomenon sp. FACHB-1399]MBD2642939.1 hypothetical protein [Aphanizomenon sp. FACHB-1401]MBD2675601.1 hypothetical protein [Aphanizomenon flos-aquae FACHB-1416]